MAAILMSDKLEMDEGDILDKVTEWATVNSVRLHPNFSYDPTPSIKGDSRLGNKCRLTSSYVLWTGSHSSHAHRLSPITMRTSEVTIV